MEIMKFCSFFSYQHQRSLFSMCVCISLFCFVKQARKLKTSLLLHTYMYERCKSVLGSQETFLIIFILSNTMLPLRLHAVVHTICKQKEKINIRTKTFWIILYQFSHKTIISRYQENFRSCAFVCSMKQNSIQ